MFLSCSHGTKEFTLKVRKEKQGSLGSNLCMELYFWHLLLKTGLHRFPGITRAMPGHRLILLYCRQCLWLELCLGEVQAGKFVVSSDCQCLLLLFLAGRWKRWSCWCAQCRPARDRHTFCNKLFSTVHQFQVRFQGKLEDTFSVFRMICDCAVRMQGLYWVSGIPGFWRMRWQTSDVREPSREMHVTLLAWPQPHQSLFRKLTSIR